MPNPPGMYLDDYDKIIGFSFLWRSGFMGQGVTVALLDSGVDAGNNALATKIIENKDFTGEDLPSGKGLTHGTRMARHITGIAPQTSIANLRVLPVERVTRPRVAQAVAEAISFSLTNFPQPQIINVSLSLVRRGCPSKCVACRAVADAAESGALVFVAAGNGWGGPVTCPAVSPGASAVAALASVGWNRWWMNLPLWRRFWWRHSGKLGAYAGTSLSSATLSAVAALLLSIDFPLTREQVLRALAPTTDDEAKEVSIPYAIRTLIEALGTDLEDRICIPKSGELAPYALACHRYRQMRSSIAHANDASEVVMVDDASLDGDFDQRVSDRYCAKEALKFIDYWLITMAADLDGAIGELSSLRDLVIWKSGLEDCVDEIERLAQTRGLKLSSPAR